MKIWRIFGGKNPLEKNPKRKKSSDIFIGAMKKKIVKVYFSTTT